MEQTITEMSNSN